MLKKLLYAVVVIVLVIVAMPIFAQEDQELNIGGLNVVFRVPDSIQALDLSEFFLETPAIQAVGQEGLNLRTGPDVGYQSLGGLAAGSIVQMLYQQENTDPWALVRAINSDGHYTGFGWINVTQAQLADLATPVPLVSLPECELVGTGMQLVVNVRFENGYLFDALSTECNTLVEGRQFPEERHSIWTLRDRGTVLNTTSTVFGVLYVMEGSAWAYDSSWNMDDVTAVKPPIGEEFVVAKHENMLDNNYEFPIIWHQANGSIIEYAAGEVPSDVVLFSSCDDFTGEFLSPEPIEVAGIVQEDGTFVASVGDHQCRTLAYGNFDDDPADVEARLFTNAVDNFEFSTIWAFMIPQEWNDAQIGQHMALIMQNNPSLVWDLEPSLEGLLPQTTAPASSG